MPGELYLRNGKPPVSRWKKAPCLSVRNKQRERVFASTQVHLQEKVSLYLALATAYCSGRPSSAAVNGLTLAKPTSERYIAHLDLMHRPLQCSSGDVVCRLLQSTFMMLSALASMETDNGARGQLPWLNEGKTALAQRASAPFAGEGSQHEWRTRGKRSGRLQHIEKSRQIWMTKRWLGESTLMCFNLGASSCQRWSRGPEARTTGTLTTSMSSPQMQMRRIIAVRRAWAGDGLGNIVAGCLGPF